MKRVFLRGLAFILPITLTMYLLYWLIVKTEQATSYIMSGLGVGTQFPGSGFLITIAFIFGVGALSLSGFFNNLMGSVLETIGRIPIVKTIFTPIRELMKLFGDESQHHGKKVVLVPYHGFKCIGLVTNTASVLKDPNLEDFVSVYIPMSYAFGGITILANKENLTEVGISVEKALKLAVTGWMDKA